MFARIGFRSQAPGSRQASGDQQHLVLAGRRRLLLQVVQFRHVEPRRTIPHQSPQHLREQADADGDRQAKRPDAGDHGPLPQCTAVGGCACGERSVPGLYRRRERLVGTIWSGRAAFAGKPALITWGHRDIAFRKKELDRWKSALFDIEVHEFADCGHYLAEEAPERLVPALRAFMSRR